MAHFGIPASAMERHVGVAVVLKVHRAIAIEQVCSPHRGNGNVARDAKVVELEDDHDDGRNFCNIKLDVAPQQTPPRNKLSKSLFDVDPRR